MNVVCVCVCGVGDFFSAFYTRVLARHENDVDNLGGSCGVNDDDELWVGKRFYGIFVASWNWSIRNSFCTKVGKFSR